MKERHTLAAPEKDNDGSALAFQRFLLQCKGSCSYDLSVVERMHSLSTSLDSAQSLAACASVPFGLKPPGRANQPKRPARAMRTPLITKMNQTGMN